MSRPECFWGQCTVRGVYSDKVCERLQNCVHGPNNVGAYMPHLMSGELTLLGHYMRQTPNDRATILAEALRTPSISGPLVMYYKALLFV